MDTKTPASFACEIVSTVAKISIQKAQELPLSIGECLGRVEYVLDGGLDERRLVDSMEPCFCGLSKLFGCTRMELLLPVSVTDGEK